MKENLISLLQYITDNHLSDIWIKYLLTYDDDYAHHIIPINFETRALIPCLKEGIKKGTLAYDWEGNPSFYKVFLGYTENAGIEAAYHIDGPEGCPFRLDRIISYGSNEVDLIPVIYDKKSWIEDDAFIASQNMIDDEEVLSNTMYFSFVCRTMLRKLEGMKLVDVVYGNNRTVLTLKADIVRSMYQNALNILNENHLYGDGYYFNRFVFIPAMFYEWTSSEDLFCIAAMHAMELKPWKEENNRFRLTKVFEIKNHTGKED